MATLHDNDGASFSAGIGFGLIAAVIWGTWPVLSRLGVQTSMDAFDVGALRFAVAGLVLLPFVFRRGIARIGWLGVALLVGGAGIPYVLASFIGLSIAPAGHGGVIIPSCMLTFSTIGSWIFLKDRPDKTRLVGLTLVVTGVVLIGWQGFAAERTNDREWIGHLLFVAAGFCWATFTVASRVWKVDAFDATALVSVVSMVLYLPVYLAFGDSKIMDAPVFDVALQAVFQGLVVGILALLAYTRAVVILGAARGAIFASLVPGFSVLLAYPILGEVPSPYEIAGAAIVTIGMIWALGIVQGMRQRRVSAPKTP